MVMAGKKIGKATREAVKPWLQVLRWPKRMSLNEWSTRNAYLPAGITAEPGKWRSIPYQVGIMDAISDPAVEMVSVEKSARVGYTRILLNVIGYYIEHDPCAMMMVQPTIDDAEDFSKEEIDAMLNDTPCLSGLVVDTCSSGKRKNTLSWKKFPGGTLRLIGSNSPRGFRRVSIRIMLFDEVDAYPIEAGREGDPISLGIKRTESFWNRKIIAGSTPTTDALSRIDILFKQGDQRRYYVPCPHCGHMHVLQFKNLKWPEGEPEKAHFVCPECEQAITHDKKIWMVERGEWRATKPFNGHASFHIWSAYSYLPNATWCHIAKAFEEAKEGGPRLLKTFVNTWLGEVWKDTAEAPDWNHLYARREPYKRGTVPAGAALVTAGVDVQRDRLEVEVTAWGPSLESWVVDYLVFPGDTANVDSQAWKDLSLLLAKQFESETGLTLPIEKMLVDANFETLTVCKWCRQHGSRTLPVKGYDRLPRIVMPPKAVDVKQNGKWKKRGVRLLGVGSSHIKRELYGFLRLPVPTESSPIPDTGYCHFGEFLDEWYFKMLTAEVLERTYSKQGVLTERWHLPANRRNEALDCRVYSRAAAYLCGVDNMLRAQSEAGVDEDEPELATKNTSDNVTNPSHYENPRPTPPPPKSVTEAVEKRRRSPYWS